MSLSERRTMWMDRIQSFKESDEKSVTAWCRKNQINVNSMYSWLKKDALSQANDEQESTQWVPVQSQPVLDAFFAWLKKVRLEKPSTTVGVNGQSF